MTGEPAPAMVLLPREVRHRRRVIRTIGTILLVLLLIGGGVGWLLRDRLSGDNEPVVAGVVGTPGPGGVVPPAATAPPTPTRTGPGRSVLDTTPTPTGERPTPNAGAGEEAATEPADTGEPTAPSDDEGVPEVGGERDLVDLLPSEEDVPEGMVGSDPDQRLLEDVATNLGGGDAKLRLTEWGWEGNYVKSFTLSPDAAPAGAVTTDIIVSVHRFGSPEAASEAFTYFSDILLQDPSYEDFLDVEQIGDETRLLKGPTESVLLVVVYVRDGNALYRIGGSSALESDATDDILAVARAMVAK